MTLEAPLFEQNASYPAAAVRGLVGAMLVPGVLEVTDLEVTQRAAGVNMSVDVSAGSCVIEAAVSSRGRYLCKSTAVENIVIDPAPSTGNSRTDIVIASVLDTEYGDATDEWVIEVITGTPVGLPTVPTVPTTPAGSIVLARVRVTAGDAAVTDAAITDRRHFAKPLTAFGSETLPQSQADPLLAIGDDGLFFNGDGGWGHVPDQYNFGVGAVTIARTLPVGASMTATGGVASVTVAAGSANVSASFMGDVYNAGGAVAEGSCRVGISLDGGSSWTYGGDVGAGPENTAASVDPEVPIVAQHVRTGTTTGAVQARLMTRRTPGDSWNIAGTINVVVMPG